MDHLRLCYIIFLTLTLIPALRSRYSTSKTSGHDLGHSRSVVDHRRSNIVSLWDGTYATLGIVFCPETAIVIILVIVCFDTVTWSHLTNCDTNSKVRATVFCRGFPHDSLTLDPPPPKKHKHGGRHAQDNSG